MDLRIFNLPILRALVSDKMYIVGGYVRDSLLERESKDIDLAFEGDALEFLEGFLTHIETVEYITEMQNILMVPISFLDSKNDIKEKGKEKSEKEQESIRSLKDLKINKEYSSFSFCISLPDKNVDYSFTVTSTRKETFTDKVIMQPSDILEDLSRRDFSINAIALNLKTEKVLDPFNGIEDLKARKLRSITSYSEDPSRIVRAIRYKQILDFSFAEGEEEKIKEAIALIKLEHLYRIKRELDRVKLNNSELLNLLKHKMDNIH